MDEPTQEQKWVAACLDLPPDLPQTWPMDIIERLISTRNINGHEAFLKACHDLMGNWATESRHKEVTRLRAENAALKRALQAQEDSQHGKD